MQTMKRSRSVYVVMVAMVIVLGLSSRHWRYVLPAILQKNAGDGLWALMVFLLVGLLSPALSTPWTALVAMAFSAADEFSQIYHAPWIDAIRATTLGHLVLGSGFSWVDMLDYAIGIAFGAAAEQVYFYLRKERARRKTAR